MRRLLKNELRKMFSSKYFWFVILLGCGITGWHFVQYVLPREINDAMPDDVYKCWIGASSFKMQTYWYFLFLPLWAVMPYAGNYFEEQRDGYFKNIITKTTRKNWFTAKGIALWLSGGLGVTVPLIFNFLLTACRLPLLKPEPYNELGPNVSSLGVALYYEHPLIYTILFLMIDFMVGGCIALSVALLTNIVEYKFVALLIPYGFYYILYTVSMYMETTVIEPSYYLVPGNGFENVLSLGLLLGYCIIVIILYIGMAWKYEE